MRLPLIAGNWKMHKTIEETMSFASAFSSLYFGDEEGSGSRSGTGAVKVVERNGKGAQAGESDEAVPEVLICPPFTSIAALSVLFAGKGVQVGAQDLHWEEKGAFTGEISAPMLKDAGASYVIVGHSERRQFFGETDETCSKKVRAALDHGLTPVLCVGETLGERDKGDTLKVVERMTLQGLSQVRSEEATRLVIAYEPVWAIGTGKEAKPDDAVSVISGIRKVLDGLLGDGAGQEVRVLYGGSVSPDNIRSFMEHEDIDGALIGGASLDPQKFYRIILETKKVRRH